MKKNDLFIDVSSHNGYDITGVLADMVHRILLSKFLKVQAISTLACPLKLSNQPLLDFIIRMVGGDFRRGRKRGTLLSLIMYLKK